MTELKKIQKDFKNKGDEDSGYTAAFSGQKVKFDGEKINGFGARAVFGGVEIK